MNSLFIQNSLWHAAYYAHTANAFHISSIDECYLQTFDKSERNKLTKAKITELVEGGELCYLPHKLTILRGDEMLSVANVGRQAKMPMIAQLKGKFTKAEDSPYKEYLPYEIQTGLWRVEGFQSYYVGSLGVSGLNGRITKDNGDMIIVHTTDWRTVEVFVFRGLAGTQKQLDYLPEVMTYLRNYQG